MADGTATGLKCYGPCHKKHFLSTKMSMLVYWEFFVTGQKFRPSSTLSKLTREHGREKPSTPRFRRSFQDTVTKCLGTRRAGALEESAYVVQSEKTWL
jgi:hypothetical protein